MHFRISKNTKIALAIILLLLTVIILFSVLYLNAGSEINNKNEAIIVAKRYVGLFYFYKNFDNMSINTIEGNDVWIVYWTNETGGVFPSNDGGPCVYIRKSNSIVTSSYLLT